MMVTSLRWVARTCSHPGCITPRPTASSVKAPSTAACFTTHRHQRRYSSSKPPVPPNHGSSNIPAASQGSVKTVTPKSKTLSEKRAGSESRMSKRKSKDKAVSGAAAKNDMKMNIPSVPPTQYLQPKDVHLASLFSSHRPMSITTPIPTTVDDTAFASIFAPRTKKNKNGSNEVVYTLSSAVKVLDQVIQQHNPDGKGFQQESEEVAQMRNALAQQMDGQQQQSQPQVQYFTDLKLALDELAKTFRPFNPPPAPVPMTEEQIAAQEEQEKSGSSIHQGKEFSADGDFIQEIVIFKPDGEATLNPEFFTSQGPQKYFPMDEPLSQVEFPSGEENTTEISNPFSVSRLPIRAPSATPKRSFVPKRRVTKTEQIIHAISVKRQRKLKMKKHKYKKLMRRTRNLRRKLGQL